MLICDVVGCPSNALSPTKIVIYIYIFIYVYLVDVCLLLLPLLLDDGLV